MPVLHSTIYSLHPISGVNLHLWQLTESLEDLCALLRDGSLVLDEPYVSFKSEKRKKEWVAVRVLLGQVVQQPLSICYKSNGKPYLSPFMAEFSVSHTKDVVGIVMSDLPVGLDVEQKGPRPLKLISQFVHADDYQPVNVSFAELMAAYMWSAKESVYKLLGIPGIELLSDIRLVPRSVGEEYSEFVANIPRISQTALVRCYSYPTFVMTIATYA